MSIRGFLIDIWGLLLIGGLMGRTSMSTLFLLSAVYETISVSEVNSNNALCVCVHMCVCVSETLLCRNLKHCWFRTSTNSDSKSWSLYQAPPVTERSGCRLYNMYTFFLDACA